MALLPYTQKRGEEALQHKLDALADGLADLMERFAEDDPDRRAASKGKIGVTYPFGELGTVGKRSRR